MPAVRYVKEQINILYPAIILIQKITMGLLHIHDLKIVIESMALLFQGP